MKNDIVKIPQYHMIEVTFLSSTQHLPARVKLYSCRFNQSIIVGYYDERVKTTIVNEIAMQVLRENNFNVLGFGLGKKGCVIMTDTFKTFNNNKNNHNVKRTRYYPNN